MQTKIAELLRSAARLMPDHAQDLEAVASRLDADDSREAILAAKEAAAAAYRVAQCVCMHELRYAPDLHAEGARKAAEVAYEAALEALGAS